MVALLAAHPIVVVVLVGVA